MDSQDLALAGVWEDPPWAPGPDIIPLPPKHVWPEPLTTACFLLERLPKEIRHAILRLLLYRPTGIVPFTANHRVRSGPVPRYIYKNKHYTGINYPRKSGWKGSRGYYYDDKCTGNPLGHSLHLYSKYPRWDCGPLKVIWTTPASGEQLRLIRQARRSTGDRFPDVALPDSMDPESGTSMTNLLHYRRDGSIEVIHSREAEVTPIAGVQILRTCQKLYAEGSEILYGENLFVFNSIREPYEGGFKYFRVDDDLTRFEYHLPGISRDPSLVSKNQVSAALQELFDPSMPYPKVMSEADTYPFTEFIPPQAFRPPFTGYSIIFWDSFLAFFRQIGILNASLLTKIKLEGIFYGHWPLPGETTAPLDFSDMLRCYVTVMSRICVNLKSLTLHTPYAHAQDYDAKMRAEESVALIVNSLPGLRKMQLGQYRLRPLDYQDNWDETVRWSQVVHRRSQGGQQVPQRSIGDIIAEINREAQEYHEEMTSQFDALPFKEAGCVDYEFTSRSQQKKANRELFKLIEFHPTTRHKIYLGPVLGYKPFKWSGWQYPNYRWLIDGSFAWTEQDWDMASAADTEKDLGGGYENYDVDYEG
ncbi:hypothetical protein HYFRA_00001408 [Hymenoscyphus fraxineus]|uniref:Uncharacterized protein n=1 Tax=Hymenoscyphus fraxineus TaxID=746836 RepID=A0A9N9PMD6_9HELO|nr:hypothetical protein HYFRA_00001408 [Hymenoscyphus fraxineus]